MTEAEILARAKSALAMSVSETHKLCRYLEQRARDLRAEADAIDEMLRDGRATRHGDSWYETFKSDEAKAARAATPTPSP